MSKYIGFGLEANRPATGSDGKTLYICTDTLKIYWSAGNGVALKQLGAAIPIAEKGVANGVAELDANGVVVSSQLPSFVDDVLEFADFASFPGTGEASKIYLDKTENKSYRWSGSVYVFLGNSLALGETSSTAYRGDRGKAAYDHSQTTHETPGAAATVQGNLDTHTANHPAPTIRDTRNQVAGTYSTDIHANAAELAKIGESGGEPTYDGAQLAKQESLLSIIPDMVPVSISYDYYKNGSDIILSISGENGNGIYSYTVNGVTNETGVFTLTVDGEVSILVIDSIASSFVEITLNVRALSWSAQMADDYIAQNAQCFFDERQRNLIIDRLEETYIVDTFGSAGQNKTTCDFFVFLETAQKTDALANGGRVVTKTGELIRWNYGGGNVYSQNLYPNEICASGVITLTSEDGWGGLTEFTMNTCHLIGNFSGFNSATNLQTLTLSLNKLTAINVSDQWTSLIFFYIENNFLSTLNIPSTLMALDYLYATNNRLEIFKIPDNITGIKRLHLNDNHLLYFEKFPVGFTSFERLYLDGNKLSFANFRSTGRKLITLNLSENNVADILGVLASIKSTVVDGGLTPYYNTNIDIRYGGNKAYTDLESNADYVALVDYYAISGKTFVVTYNAEPYTAPIASKASYPKPIIDYDFINDKTFFSSALVDVYGRLYCFYRDGRSHNSMDGRLMMVYSDTNGVYWSIPEFLYDGSNILVEEPDILIADPRTVTDVRDIDVIMSEDNTILVAGMIRIGYNLSPEDTDPVDPENIDRIEKTSDTRSFVIRLKITERDYVDTSNIEPIPIPTYGAYSGGLVQYKGITLITVYTVDTVSLLRSDDLGLTWYYLSDIFSTSNHPSNETALCFNTYGALYVLSRGVANEGYLAWSYDFGKSWEGYITVPARIDGHMALPLSNGRILWFGRRTATEDYALSYFITDHDQIGDPQPIVIIPDSNPDRGYGNVCEHNGKYLYSYSHGPAKPYPNVYSLSNTGLFFVEIDKTEIDNL